MTHLVLLQITWLHVTTSGILTGLILDKINSSEYSCTHKLNPFAPFRWVFCWVWWIIHLQPPQYSWVWVFPAYQWLCIHLRAFVSLFPAVCVCCVNVCLCAAAVCMQIDWGCFTSYLLSSLMSSATFVVMRAADTVNCGHSDTKIFSMKAGRHKDNCK